MTHQSDGVIFTEATLETIAEWKKSPLACAKTVAFALEELLTRVEQDIANQSRRTGDRRVKTEELEALLKKVAYPGWQWELKAIPYGHVLRGAFERPDRETGAMGTGYSRWEILAEDCTPDSVIKTCWVLVKLTVEHEAMEFFCFEGKRVFDPHMPVERLISLQEATV